MNETVPTMQQQVAPIWVKTEQTPDIPGYEVQKLLGQGGMGQVYQARHLSQQRMVAIKLVTATHNELAVARFEQEVQAIACLRHPNIAQIYDNGMVNGRPYYSMEFLAGGTLSERLKTSPLQPQVAAKLLVKLARAMQHAHDQGILHRDLKPSNVLLDSLLTPTGKGVGGEGNAVEELEPKVADFGLAKRLDTDSSLTQTGDVFGSPSYMAPEQASGIGKLGPAVDIYALGAVLYQCLTGRPPFLGPDPMLTLMMVLSNDPIPPRDLLPKLPLDLNTICLKCLEKQPRKRYGSASEMADDLERYLNGEPIRARPVGRWERSIKWARRRPWQAAAIGLAAALLIGSVVGLVILVYAYQKVVQANENFQQSFSISRTAMSQYLNKLAGEFSNVPNVDRFLLDTQKSAVDIFRQLHKLRPDDKATAMEFFDRLEQLHTQLTMNRQFAEAEKISRETELLLKTIRSTHPVDVDGRLCELRYAINQSWLYRIQGDLQKALPYDIDAMKRLNDLKREQPENVNLIRYSNDLLKNNVSDELAKLSQSTSPADKQSTHKRIIELHREIVKNSELAFQLDPNHTHAVSLVANKKSLAAILNVLGNHDEAESLNESVAKSLPYLKLTEREEAGLMVHIAIDRIDFALRRRDWKLIDTIQADVTQKLRWLRTQYPDDIAYLHDEFLIAYKSAMVLHEKSQRREAIELLHKTIQQLDQTISNHPEYPELKDTRTNLQQLLTQYQRTDNTSQSSTGK